jgi:uncharacterized protein GlcG (DUF336 family)
MDDALKDPSQEKAIDKAYTAFFINKATKKQKEIVYECERKAWEYGKALARRLKIRLGKWYLVEQEAYLKDYQEEVQSNPE